jgi:predicted RNA-binding protein YlqC (UPF0109 family)
MDNTKEILAEAMAMLTNGKFEVFTSNEGGAVSHQIIVDRSEYGKVCGSKGKMIRAIKHIWEVCIARGADKPIRVNLREPSSGFAEGRNAEVPSDNFSEEDFAEIIEEIISFSCDVSVDYEKLSSGSSHTHVFFIAMDDPPEYLGDEFKEAFNVLFHAMAKANGGYVKFDFNGQ